MSFDLLRAQETNRTSENMAIIDAQELWGSRIASLVKSGKFPSIAAFGVKYGFDPAQISRWVGGKLMAGPKIYQKMEDALMAECV